MTLLIPYAGLESSPWKNGAGSTIEIATAPTGATLENFDWRISLATFIHNGPFSLFTDVERTLAFVDGAGATLRVDGTQNVILSEDEPIFEFSGDSEIEATLIEGPTMGFNVMTRNESCHHRLGRRALKGASGFAPRGDVTVLFLAEGESLSVSSDAERIGLVRYDTLLFDTTTFWKFESSSAVVLIVDIFMNGD